MNISNRLYAAAAALLLISAGSSSASAQQTTVHKQTTTTHTEHREGVAPVKVTVARKTMPHRTAPAHKATVTKKQTQSSTSSTTVEQH